MCLALPAQIVEIDETTDSAIASLGGVKKEISLALVEDARWVITCSFTWVTPSIW